MNNPNFDWRGSMTFLSSGDAIRQAMGELLDAEDSKPARLAVAFWGRSAEYQLVGPCRIVCDLGSGACNPDTIVALRKRPNTSVLQLSGLHAKVVITSSGAIVSSANMSTNGLGLASDRSAGTFEAGIRVSPETSEYKELDEWFETIWKKAVQIEEEDVARARRLWELKNQAFDDFDAAKAVDASTSSLEVIDAKYLLKESILPRHRMRAVKPEILLIARSALPELNERQLGKIATYACHALLCRSGTDLDYATSEGKSGGLITEEWIYGRFSRVGPDTSSQVNAVLNALAGNTMVNNSVRQAAMAVLRDPVWPSD